MASISIFCRKRTTGASSTSVAAASASGAGLASSVTSNSKSDEAMALSWSSAEAVWPSSSLASLSCSTMTHSGVSWVANLMRSMASWSVGSAPATKRRLPRLDSTSTWYWADSLLSITPLGRRCTSMAEMSSTGTARACDSVCARSVGWMAPLPTSVLTKLRFCSRAVRVRVSADLASSLPALTSTRATPESVPGASARVDSAAMKTLEKRCQTIG